MTPALPFPMVARVPAQISNLLPFRKLVRCTEAQKRLFASPLLATLTHSLSRKSFPCHSYANTRDGGATIAPVSAPLSAFDRHMRHVAPLSLVASVDCAYFLSPRGVPFIIPDVRGFRPFQRAISFVYKTLPPLCRLFALFSAFVSFVFNRLQPLFQKHPGRG